MKSHMFALPLCQICKHRLLKFGMSQFVTQRGGRKVEQEAFIYNPIEVKWRSLRMKSALESIYIIPNRPYTRCLGLLLPILSDSWCCWNVVAGQGLTDRILSLSWLSADYDLLWLLYYYIYLCNLGMFFLGGRPRDQVENLSYLFVFIAHPCGQNLSTATKNKSQNCFKIYLQTKHYSREIPFNICLFRFPSCGAEFRSRAVHERLRRASLGDLHESFALARQTISL